MQKYTYKVASTTYFGNGVAAINAENALIRRLKNPVLDIRSLVGRHYHGVAIWLFVPGVPDYTSSVVDLNLGQ